tara:strand:- start:701 stop:1201 length:501 start_codon:yes stop_codon:yes gene_type:complete
LDSILVLRDNAVAKVKCRLAFYKGEGEWHNSVVRYWTSSPYSHVELILADESAISITPFDQMGVRRKKLYQEPNDWDYLDIEINQWQYKKLLNFYYETMGEKYDWIGMLTSQFLPFHIKRIGRWYCSEWIAYGLRLAGVIHKVYAHADLSPQKLYDLIVEERIKKH